MGLGPVYSTNANVPSPIPTTTVIGKLLGKLRRRNKDVNHNALVTTVIDRSAAGVFVVANIANGFLVYRQPTNFELITNPEIYYCKDLQELPGLIAGLTAQLRLKV